MSDAKPYTMERLDAVLSEWEQGGKPRFVSDDLRATVRALDNANQREAAIWAALSRAGVSHGQSVEGLKEGLSVVRTKRGLMAERDEWRARAETAEAEAVGLRSRAETAELENSRLRLLAKLEGR